MPNDDISPLELLEQVAASIDPADRARYSEIFELLANESPLLLGSEAAREYNNKIFGARGDLLRILRRAAARGETGVALQRLIRHYDGRDV